MPLKGIKVLELAGLAPVPFCGQILRDFGASVTRVANVYDPMESVAMFKYGKDLIRINLKNRTGVEILRRIVEVEKTDVFLDPFRPGVLEKLGLGPDHLLYANPGLVYTRLSGFGQTGPMKHLPGHDINYASLSGVLSLLGDKGRPPLAPINLLADFAGGSVLCSLGIVMALFERSRSGKGQVIDHSMTEGTAYMASFLFETLKNQSGLIWPNHPERNSNLLDGGAPFYRCYETADGKFLAVGCIEPKFFAEFCRIIGFDDSDSSQLDTDSWPEMANKFADILKSKTRDEWMELFEGTEACVTPVLEIGEVASHDLHISRSCFNEDGLPEPVPVMSRTPGRRDSHIESETKTVEVLKRIGYEDSQIEEFKSNGIVA